MQHSFLLPPVTTWRRVHKVGHLIRATYLKRFPASIMSLIDSIPSRTDLELNMELKHTRTILILLCIVINTFAFTVRNGEEQDREGVPIVKPSLWEIFKNGFSLYTTSSPLKVTSYWEKVKMFMQPLHAYFFPPNLEYASQLI